MSSVENGAGALAPASFTAVSTVRPSRPKISVILGSSLSPVPASMRYRVRRRAVRLDGFEQDAVVLELDAVAVVGLGEPRPDGRGMTPNMPPPSRRKRPARRSVQR
jgi:hypothetical protein